MSYYETEANSVLLHLKGLPSSFCNAMGVRKLLCDVKIPAGEVHVLGGHYGQAFIKVESAEEAVKALRHDGQEIGDQKVEVRLSNREKKLKVVGEFRDEDGPSLAAVAAAALIKQLTIGSGERTSGSVPKSEVETEAEELKFDTRSITSHMGNMDLGSAMMEPSGNRDSSTLDGDQERNEFVSRQVLRAPLLLAPENSAIPPLCPEFASFPSVRQSEPGLIPLMRGGYWVACKKIPAAWGPEQFEDLVKNKMGITNKFVAEKMMYDNAYAVFYDKESYLKFLKCVGYLADPEVPKLDDSILCGMTAWPCAECNYAFQKLQEDKLKLFNRPGPKMESDVFPRGGPPMFNRGYRGGRFHNDGRSYRGGPPGSAYRGGMYMKRDGNFQMRGEFRGRADGRGRGRARGRGYFERRRHDSRSSPENKHRGPEMEKMDVDEPPRKMFRSCGKELASNDLRRRLRHSSSSSTDSRPTENKDCQKKEGGKNRSYGENSPRSGSEFFRDRKRHGGTQSPRGSITGDDWSGQTPQRKQSDGDSFNSSTGRCSGQTPRRRNDNYKNLKRESHGSDDAKSDEEANRRKSAHRRGYCIRLFNLPYRATPAEVSAILKDVAGLVSNDVTLYKDQKHDDSEAIIIFKREEEAEQAKGNLNGLKYGGRRLRADLEK